MNTLQTIDIELWYIYAAVAMVVFILAIVQDIVSEGFWHIDIILDVMMAVWWPLTIFLLLCMLPFSFIGWLIKKLSK